MTPTIYFVHTIGGIEKTFNDLAGELIGPDIKCRHISDESLIRRIIANQGLTKDVRRRFMENIIAAEDAGADLIQVTCSSVTPVIPCARELVDIPVFSVDEPMAELAVGSYRSIGVMATNAGTLAPSSDLLRDKAREQGKDIQILPVLCEGAYQVLLSGDKAAHDRIVSGYFRDLAEKTEVIVLAQASMARVVDTLDEKQRKVPVLTSPRPAMENLAKYLLSQSGNSPAS